MPGIIDKAVVVCPGPDVPEAGVLGVRVAGVPLLLRVLLTAERAGIQRFTVVASGPQQGALRGQLDGVPRLRGRVQWLEPKAVAGSHLARSLVLTPWAVLDPGALRRWLLRVADVGSVATAADAGHGPLAVPAPFLSACIEAALHGQSGLKAFLEMLEGDRRLARVPWEGMRPWPVRSPHELPAIERAMLAGLRSPEDGPLVDRYVNRAASGRLTRAIVASSVTPNQVTLASLLTGLLGAWLLGSEGVVSTLGGLVLFQLSVILDHVDGEVARLKLLFSPLGRWLDNVSDHLVDLSVIAMLAWRAAEERTAGHFAVLGLAAAVGVTGAFLVVFWWSVAGTPRTVRTTTLARILARVLAALANRDGFCLALWVTLLMDRATWFLWALALGANAYWAVWLLIYGVPRRAPAVVERATV